MTGARSWGRAGAVLAAILIVDQVTKALVRHHVRVGSEDPILPAVKLVHVRNEGVAFGALAGSPVVTIVVLVALAGLLVWFVVHSRRRLMWLPTGMLVGGAVGNLIDRVAIGHVTDFIKLPAWPAFNVADMGITFGVIALLIVLETTDDEADGPA